MGTPLEDALDRIRAAGGVAPAPGVTPTLGASQGSTGLTRGLQSPGLQSTLQSTLGQWEAPTPERQGPSGIMGNTLNALGWAKSAIWSTAKEGIDLFQGEGFSGKDWWNQATTDYGFGNLIHDERSVVGAGLIAMSPFTLGISGLMGAGVLADNIWADRIVGFIGDVAVDPLTYMGGMNIITRGLAGAKKARMGLVSMKRLAAQNPAEFARVMGNVSDDVAKAMLKDIDDAIVAGQKFGSMSGISRSLRKTDTGKLVGEALGFNPSLRLRVPGTGMVGKALTGSRLSKRLAATFDLDEMARATKIPEWAFNHRVRNVPKYFKNKYGDRMEEAMRITRDANRATSRNWTKAQQQAARRAQQKIMKESPELADIAGRAVKSAVEFGQEGFKIGRNGARIALGASLFARADTPMRATRRVVAPEGSKRAAKIADVFQTDARKRLRPFLDSGDPNYVAEGWLQEDYIRSALGRESMHNTEGRRGREAVGRRFKHMGFNPREDGHLLSDLDEADILIKQPDGTYALNKNRFYDGLDPRLKNLSDDDLLLLKAELEDARLARQNIYEEEFVNPQTGVWDAAARIRAEEGDQYLHRNLTDKMKGEDWFGFDEVETAAGGLGRGEPNSLKSRGWRVRRGPNGEMVGGVHIPEAVVNQIRKANKRVHEEIDAVTGEIRYFLANPDGTKFIIQDPRVVNRSVRQQINAQMRALTGEDMFENDWFKLMDHGNARMGKAVRVAHFENRLRNIGTEFDDNWRNAGNASAGWSPQGPRGLPPGRGGPTFVPSTRGGPPGLSPAPTTAQVTREVEGQVAVLSANTNEAFAQAKAATPGRGPSPAAAPRITEDEVTERVVKNLSEDPEWQSFRQSDSYDPSGMSVREFAEADAVLRDEARAMLRSERRTRAGIEVPEGAARAQAVSPVVDDAADAWQKAQQTIIDAVAESKIAGTRMEEIGERLAVLKPDPEVVARGRYRVPKEVNDLVEKADGIATRMVQLGDEVAPQVQLQGVESAKVLNAAEGAEGPWTRKLLNTNAQRQADVGTGKSVDEMSYGEQLVDLDRFAEKIDVPDPTYGPLGEITINYNHPWYRSHGERVAEISWNPKETFGAGLFEKTPLQQAPVRQRAAWARPVLRKVKQIVDEMTDEGITVVADVAKDRRSLIRLYENAGFVQVPRGAAPVSTAAQQTPLDLFMLAREGMVEMVRRPTSQSPAATYRALNDAFQTMNQNFTHNVDRLRAEITPLITEQARRINSADGTVQAGSDVAKGMQGQIVDGPHPAINKMSREINEFLEADAVVRHNEFLDGVPAPEQVQNTLTAASEAAGEATRRVGAEAVLGKSVLDDAARGVNVRSGKEVVEGVADGALESRNAEALISDAAQDFEAYDQLRLFGDNDLADAALLDSNAKARDALNISAAEAPLEAGGYVADDIPGKFLMLRADDVPTAALAIREAVANFGSGPPRGGRVPPGGAGGGGVPPGNGGVSGMAGGAPWDPRFQAIIEGVARINDPSQFASRDSVFWNGWDKFQNYLKAGMIATPGFVNRNIMGAFFNAWLDGVPPSEMMKSAAMTRQVWARANSSANAGTPISFLTAAEQLAKTDADFVNYVGLLKRGVRGGGQAVTAVEMQQTIGGLKNLDFVFGQPGSKKVRRVTLAPWSSQNVLFKGVRDVNGWVEDMIRLGVGMDTLKNGGSLDDALNRIAKSQFDYSELSQFEQEWMRRFVPFYTWTRKNVPYQLKQLGAHPYKYNRIMAVKRNLELGTKEEGVVPDYYMEPFGIRMPFSRKGATVYSVPDIPFQDLLRFDPTGSEGVGGVLSNLTWQLTPLLKTPIEVATKTNLASGIPFRGDYQQVPKPLTAMKFLMPILEQVGLAKKSPLDGSWRMRDHHIYAVGNIMPTLGLLRRLWPNEERYQRRQLTTLLSVIGGLNVQFNTPEVQYSWQKSQQYEQLRKQQDLMDQMYPNR